MLINEEGVPAQTGTSPFNVQLSKNSLITILVCTGLSVLFMRTGILSFFYLAPIGYAVIVTGSILFPFLAAAITNIIIDLFTRSAAQGYTAENFASGSENLPIQILYFTSMFFIFIWIMGAKNPRTLYRLLAGSAAGAVIFILFVYKTDFFSFMERIIEEMNAQSASEGEEAINPIFGLLPAENVTELFNKVLLRGAAFFSILFIFFINRHFSYLLVRLIKKQRDDKPLTEFFAPQNAVWVLAGALGTALLAVSIKIELLEILAWNVFVMCACLFLAQGAGILTYLLSKRSAGLRLGVSIVIIFVLLSPLSLAAILLLLILGIVENWVPIRLKDRIQNASYSEAN